MSLFNEKLKNISLKEVLILIIILFLIQFIFNSLNIVHINPIWIYICIIFYFIFSLRGSFSSLKQDLIDVFSKETLKNILIVVILNIFLSYGFLYLSSVILEVFPDIGSLISFQTSSLYVANSLIALAGFVSSVFISPVCEELIFRGVLLNRMKLVVPTIFSILISSLLFASLHTYGSIIAAFIFAICMAILYLKTDNILVPIFAHFLNNLFAESIVIMDTSNVLFTSGLVIGIMSLLAILSFVLIMIFVFIELNKIK